jgi:peptidyl-tRNA hydrolase, PTH2 family
MSVEPNLFDDEQLAAIRAEQADPITMYFVVREDLNMGAGKMAAQCAHAAQMVMLRYFEKKREFGAFRYGRYGIYCDLFERWAYESFRKVILKADLKEFEKIKAEEALDVFVVRDAGITEVEPGTETVLVVWPMRKSAAAKTLLKRLRIL